MVLRLGVNLAWFLRLGNCRCLQWLHLLLDKWQQHLILFLLKVATCSRTAPFMCLQFVLRQEVTLGRAVIDIEDLGFCFDRCWFGLWCFQTENQRSRHFVVFWDAPTVVATRTCVSSCFLCRLESALEALLYGSWPLFLYWHSMLSFVVVLQEHPDTLCRGTTSTDVRRPHVLTEVGYFRWPDVPSVATARTVARQVTGNS